MLQYVQHIQDTNGRPIGEKEVARGSVNHVDELLALPFMKGVMGAIMIRRHPTDRTLANVVAMLDNKTTILAVISGDIKPGVCILEYYPPVVVDVPPYTPPEGGWGDPIPLDDLLSSGLVKKG